MTEIFGAKEEPFGGLPSPVDGQKGLQYLRGGKALRLPHKAADQRDVQPAGDALKQGRFAGAIIADEDGHLFVKRYFPGKLYCRDIERKGMLLIGVDGERSYECHMPV